MLATPRLLLGLLPFFTLSMCAKDPGKDMGQAPAFPVSLDQHFANPPSGLNMMGIYSTNFGETPYCCPWNPKEFEVADAGQNCIFNANGTVLLGDSWVFSNGSVAYYGHAGSRNGPYYFGFAMDKDRKTLNGFYTFQDEANSTEDGGILTGPWIWTFVREPTVAECRFALRETRDTVSPLSGSGEDDDR